MRSKGQVELIALAGIALLILGAIAYFMFFRQPATQAVQAQPSLVVQLKVPKKAVCVNGAADVQLSAFNPTDKPAAVSVNASAENSTVAAVVGGTTVDLPFSATLPPADFLIVHLYVSPHAPGNHTVKVTVTYLIEGMQKPVTETLSATIMAKACS